MADRSAPTPEGTASLTEEMRRFGDALGRLTEEKRVVVLMVDAEGFTGEEVARALDIPLGTVWTRLHYAREELRRVLGSTIVAPGRGDAAPSRGREKSHPRGGRAPHGGRRRGEAGTRSEPPPAGSDDERLPSPDCLGPWGRRR